MSDGYKRIGQLSAQVSVDVENFRKALEKLPSPFANSFSFIMGRDTKAIYDRTMRAQKVDIPFGDYELPIYLSDNVPEDTVWMVESIANTYSKPFEMPPDWDETVEKVRRSMQSMFERQWAYGADAYGMKPTVRTYQWRRMQYESLESWGARLHASGAIDVPEVRWAYQKAVMSAPWSWVERVVLRQSGAD